MKIKKKKTQRFSEELFLNLQFNFESVNKDSQILNNSTWLWTSNLAFYNAKVV